ncbi:MAG: type II secretion system protein GspC [Deltaproteobacteria bacterium]
MSSSLQMGLTKYFWALNLVFLLGASYLSAKTVNVVLAERIRPAPRGAESTPVLGSKGTEEPLLSPEAFAKMMGMTLPEPAPLPDASSGGPDAEKPADLSSEPVRTSLHAQLFATVLANRPQWSLCTLRDLTQNDTSVYMVGDTFMGAKVLDIQDLRVIFLNDGHREFLDLDQAAPAVAPMAGVAKKEDLGAGIRKLDDHHYQIERSTVNGALSNLNDLAMQARIVPSFKNGQANGFKLFSIRPDSLYSKIGVQNGDVIQRINGFDMNSPDKALEAYTKLRSASSLDLSVERNGQTVNYHYAIQ